jgi:hypothetical protein
MPAAGHSGWGLEGLICQKRTATSWHVRPVHGARPVRNAPCQHASGDAALRWMANKHGVGGARIWSNKCELP